MYKTIIVGLILCLVGCGKEEKPKSGINLTLGSADVRLVVENPGGRKINCNFSFDGINESYNGNAGYDQTRTRVLTIFSQLHSRCFIYDDGTSTVTTKVIINGDVKAQGTATNSGGYPDASFMP